MWLLISLVLLPHLRVHICIEVITSERNERPQRDGHFVIPGLNLSSLGTFTMCGRFNIYQFIVHSERDSGKYYYKVELVANYPSVFTITEKAPNFMSTYHASASRSFQPGSSRVFLRDCENRWIVCSLQPYSRVQVALVSSPPTWW